jgi:small conductance mechanosensitive channel
VELLLPFVPSVVAIAGVVLLLFIVHRVLERGGGAVIGHKFRNQSIMLALTAAGILVVILVVPIGDAKRGQLLSLIGILLTAAIALSSTTFLGNAMAGVMLRAVRNFRLGDFIRTGEHFGRVSERGLFHTEIQTKERDLTTLPNLFLVTHPVTTTRSSGTIVSVTVSLGYDVERKRIEELLLEAALRAKLAEPFVHVLKLGDFSVTYRISGLLSEVKQLLTVRARLRACVMDCLHEGGVEIVSPNFMNQRVFAEGKRFVPRSKRAAEEADAGPVVEEIVFDKADAAESTEELRANYKALCEEIEALEKRLKDEGEPRDKDREGRQLAALKLRKERLEKLLEKPADED